MGKPVAHNQPGSAFAFYIQRDADDDQLYLDNRVKVSRVVYGANGNADADVQLDWLPTLRHGTVGVRGELSDAYIDQYYSPKLRCAVVEIKPLVTDLRDMPVVIHGYIDAKRLTINGSPNASGTYMRRTMKVRSIFRRSGRRKASTIQGRYMLTEAAHAAIAAEDPPSADPPSADPLDMPWADMAKRVEALPAIFNFEGRPNRLARPVLFRDDDAWDQTAPIHLFTYDGDPDAEYWTFLQALRYLVMAYLPYGISEQIGPGELFTALSGDGAETWWDMTEAESDVLLSGNVNTGWRNMMVRNANNVSAEGMSLVEALASLGAQSGMTFHERHTNETQGDELRVLSDLDFWVEDQKPADVFHLEKNAGQVNSFGQLRSITDMLNKSNVQSANLQVDYGAVVSRAEVLGSRDWWIVTAELVPLWETDDRWDDVDADDVDDFKNDAYSDPFVVDKEGTFYARYSPHGLDFNQFDHPLVGRLWGIDPAGEIDFLNYNRESGPYVNYDVPFEIPNIPDQVRRRRMIDHPEIVPNAGEQKKARLEISFDSGDTWTVIQDAFELKKQLSAIYFKQDNLLVIGKEVADANDTIDNYYHAYINNTLRLRLTFAIELDERLKAIATSGAGGNAISPLGGSGATVMRLKEKSYQSRTVDHPGSVDPAYAATINEVDDIESLRRLAKATLAERVMAQWKGNPIIPWIEADRYDIGTPIQGIVRTPGGGDAIGFGGDSMGGRGYPHVIAKVYNVDDQTTEIVLRDHSLRKGLVGTY